MDISQQVKKKAFSFRIGFVKASIMLLMMCSTIGSWAQMKGSYSLDSRGGADFKSFKVLLDNLRKKGVSGPVTIEVAPNSGPYSAELLFKAIPGASAAAPIVIKGNGAIVYSSRSVLRIEDASYLHFDSLVFSYIGRSSLVSVVSVYGKSHDLSFTRCSIFASRGRAENTYYYSVGYLVLGRYRTSYYYRNPDTVYNVLVDGCTISNGQQRATNYGRSIGIIVGMSLNEKVLNNITIKNCDISGFGWAGIHTKNAIGLTISNNVVHNEQCTEQGPYRYGIYVQNENVNYKDTVSITKNIVRDIVRPGIYGTEETGIILRFNQVKSRVFIANNIIHMRSDANKTGLSFWSRRFTMPCYGAYNTIRLGGNSQRRKLKVTGVLTDGPTWAVVNGGFFNNIIMNNDLSFHQRRNQSYVCLIHFGEGQLSAHHNLLYLGTLKRGKYDDGYYGITHHYPYRDLKEWERWTAHATGNHMGDPEFDGPNKYVPGKKVKQMSLPVWIFREDQRGRKRNAIHPYLGAIEPIHDMAVDWYGFGHKELECAQFSAPIIATFYNNGETVERSVRIFYHKTAGDSVKVTLPGKIRPGQRRTYTFRHPALFFGTREHTVKLGLMDTDEDTTNNFDYERVKTIKSPYGSQFLPGKVFAGHWNEGTSWNPDATSNGYPIEYTITRPTELANIKPGTDYLYKFNIASLSGRNVEHDGFVIAPDSESIAINPSLSMGDTTVRMQLRIVDPVSGCDTVFERMIFIPPVPKPNFIALGKCKEDTFRLFNKTTITGPNFIQSFWELNDPDSTVTDDTSYAHNLRYVYSKPGKSQIKLTVHHILYPKLIYDTVKPVEILPSPHPSFSNSLLCHGDSTEFINTTPSGNTASYVWVFNEADTSRAMNPKYKFDAIGKQRVTLTASNAGCSTGITRELQQFFKPKARFSVSSACAGETIRFINNSHIEDGTLGSMWEFGEGSISRLNDPEHVYKRGGSYHVVLKVLSDMGCTDSVHKQVRSYRIPKVNFSWDTACLHNPVQFHNASIVPGGDTSYTYSWSFNGESQQTGRSPAYRFKEAGEKQVNLVAVTKRGCSNSLEKQVTVYPHEQAKFSADPVCEGEALIVYNKTLRDLKRLTYSWDLGDGTKSTRFYPNHHYAETGRDTSYTLRLTVTTNGMCRSKASGRVHVTARPAAEFLHEVSGTNVQFDGPQGHDRYMWRFGDGQASQEEDPFHTYAVSSGQYKVCLQTERRKCKSESWCKEIALKRSGIEDYRNGELMVIAPNPSRGQFEIRVSKGFEAKFRMYDVTGKEVETTIQTLGDGLYSMSCSEVRSGVYFIEVKGDQVNGIKKVLIQ